jgi:hypothetical protein
MRAWVGVRLILPPTKKRCVVYHDFQISLHRAYVECAEQPQMMSFKINILSENKQTTAKALIPTAVLVQGAHHRRSRDAD